MTNEQAITKLNNIAHDDLYAWSPEILEAFRMAVDALRGAEGDCISRAVASDVMEQWLYDGEDNRTVREVIYELPSAQPEHKKGKWIDDVLPNDNGGLPVQICDQCNTFFPLTYTGGGHRFCPNCGAKMEDGADGI